MHDQKHFHSRLVTLFAASLFVIAQGCSDSSTAPAPQAGTSDPNNSLNNPPGQASTLTPDQAITRVAKTFLDALRSGDSEEATKQVTPLAQQRIREAGMDFKLLASKSASYRLGKVEMLEAEEAIIEYTWTEPNENGQPEPENLMLGIARIDNKWYVRGIVADLGINQEPDVMDFENPGQATAPANMANSAQPPSSSIPQQASRPQAQDPFRQ